MNLMNWHYKKLGAFLSQEDSDIWNGNLIRNGIKISSTYFDPKMGFWSTSSIYDVFIIKIPKQAKKLTVTTTGRAISVSSAHYYGYSTETQGLLAIATVNNKYSFTINELDTNYEYVAVTVWTKYRTTPEENPILFEFSK